MTGGLVEASCRGTAFTLLRATPQDGWSVRVEHAGATGADVRFRAEEAETRVRAGCRAGVPVQTTEDDGSDDGSGDDGSHDGGSDGGATSTDD